MAGQSSIELQRNLLEQIKGLKPGNPQYDLAHRIIDDLRTYRLEYSSSNGNETPETKAIRQLAGDPRVQKAVDRYHQSPLTPQAFTDYWRARYEVFSELSGDKCPVEVPECNWTAEQIQEPMKDIKGRDLPPLILYDAGIKPLEKMLPFVSMGYTARSISQEEAKPQGWIKVEATAASPNLDTTESELRDFAEAMGYTGQSKRIYLLASLANKDLNRERFDGNGPFEGAHQTYSRLLDSFFEWQNGKFSNTGIVTAETVLASQTCLFQTIFEDEEPVSSSLELLLNAMSKRWTSLDLLNQWLIKKPSYTPPPPLRSSDHSPRLGARFIESNPT